MTFTNYAFIDFAYNWLNFVKEHEITNYVIIALDKKSYEELQMNGATTFYNPHLTASEDPQTYDSYKEWLVF